MRQRGFTIIELMVAVGVLALILMIAMPAVANWQENTRIRNTADSIHAGLQLARGEAVTRNQEVSFWLVSMSDSAVLSNDCVLSSVSASWVVSVTSPVGHCADAPSVKTAPMIVLARAGGGGVTIKAVKQPPLSGPPPIPAPPGSFITFNGFGRVTNIDSIALAPIGAIDIGGSANATPLRVTVSASGQARICMPLPSGDANDPRKC
jgi:type IV fimbrial biogenesis protein FimT